MLYYATEYLRLSYTNDKTNESDSIANQRKYIDEFVKRNPLFLTVLHLRQ